MDAATLPISPMRGVSFTIRRGEQHQKHTSPGLDGLLRMLRQVHINRYLTLSNVSIDLLRFVFPVNGSRTHGQMCYASTQYLPFTNVRSPAYVHRPARINGGPCHVIETRRNDKVFVHFWGTGLNAGDETSSNPHSDGAVTLGKNPMC
jgi:hypothetical protein